MWRCWSTPAAPCPAGAWCACRADSRLLTTTATTMLLPRWFTANMKQVDTPKQAKTFESGRCVRSCDNLGRPFMWQGIFDQQSTLPNHAPWSPRSLSLSVFLFLSPSTHLPSALLVLHQCPACEVGCLPRKLQDLVVQAQLVARAQHCCAHPADRPNTSIHMRQQFSSGGCRRIGQNI